MGFGNVPINWVISFKEKSNKESSQPSIEFYIPPVNTSSELSKKSSKRGLNFLQEIKRISQKKEENDHFHKKITDEITELFKLLQYIAKLLRLPPPPPPPENPPSES